MKMHKEITFHSNEHFLLFPLSPPNLCLVKVLSLNFSINFFHQSQKRLIFAVFFQPLSRISFRFFESFHFKIGHRSWGEKGRKKGEGEEAREIHVGLWVCGCGCMHTPVISFNIAIV